MKKSNGAYFPEEVFLSNGCLCLLMCVVFQHFESMFKLCNGSYWKLLKLFRNSANGSLNYFWQ